MLNKERGSLIISWSFKEDLDGVLLIATKKPGEIPDILNAYQGDKAREIRDMLFGLANKENNAKEN